MKDDLSPEEAKQIGARLREARIAREYKSAAAAARAMGVVQTTYQSHENGNRGLARAATRYADFFRVSLDWLLTGAGSMDGAAVKVMGRVGAGDIVTFAHDEAEIDAGAWALLPRETEAQALIVQGDSMRPRFYPGEIILYEKKPSSPSDLIGQYAVVQLHDEGSTMIKVIRGHPGAARFRLESHNADPIEDVEIYAWRWIGVLRPRSGAPPVVSTLSKRRRRR